MTIHDIFNNFSINLSAAVQIITPIFFLNTKFYLKGTTIPQKYFFIKKI